jgi:hypothetical protein
MKKRITFSANKKSTIDAIDDYSRAKGYSRSEVISFLLNATAPVLNKITSQYHIAQTLESTLGCIFEEKESLTARSEPKLTYEEFFTLYGTLTFDTGTKLSIRIFMHTKYLMIRWGGVKKN